MWKLNVMLDEMRRSIRSEDPPCSAMIIYDLEREVFFGSGQELDRCFDGLKQRARNAGSR
jgi:hypothetical protein